MTMQRVILQRCFWGLCAGVATLAMCGCHGAIQCDFIEVEIQGCVDRRVELSDNRLFLLTGESVRIDKPGIIHKLASFFPGLGSGRRSRVGVLTFKDLQWRFTKADRSTITVYTKKCRYWGSDVDRGDLDVKGDLRSYLEALFADVKIQKTATMQTKE